MFSLIKIIKEKFIALNREVIEENKESAIQRRNKIFILLRKHFGIGLILIIYLMITISSWSYVVKTKNDSWILIMPLKLVVVLLIPICITLFLYQGIVFFKQQEHIWVKVLNFIYDNIISPVIQEFDANITSFILANILIIAGLYAREWYKILNVWDTNRHALVSASSIILFGAILVPLLANFIFKLIDIFISSWRSDFHKS